MPISAVDLFCGAGGLSHGLQRGGVRVRAGIDLDPACRVPYELNNRARFLAADIGSVTADEIRPLFATNDIKLLAGCAPCQPFSQYRNGQDTSVEEDWGLLYHFSRLIAGVEPELVTMENVPQVVNHEVFAHFVHDLERAGFNVTYREVYCPDYGVPQSRRRLVLIGSRLGPVRFPVPTHDPQNYVTVQDAIGALPPIRHGETHPDDPLHKASKLTEINIARVRASRPGGTWRDWPEGLVAKCHQKKSGGSYPAVYGRMRWEEPAPTMTTLCYGFGNGRFGHPEQDRGISLREAAILQSFPREYAFSAPGETVQFRPIGRLIGNAVPPLLGEAIGRTLVRHVRAHRRAQRDD